MDTAGFDVIIVNYKAYESLYRALESLLRHEQNLIKNIFVIDNEADSQSISALMERLPQEARAHSKIHFLPQQENLGFSKAVNLGISHSSSEFLMLLNPDAYVKNPFLKDAASIFDRYPDVAVIGPRILDENGALQGSARWDPRLITAFFGRTGPLTKLFPRSRFVKKDVILDPQEFHSFNSKLKTQNSKLPKLHSFNSKLKTQNSTLPNKEPVIVDWVSGACMLIRSQAIKEVGPMDERFFIYWEDCDWCKRFRNSGWRVVYVPSLGDVVHEVGGSSTKRPLFSMYHFHRSAFLLYAKYDTSVMKIGTATAFLGGILRFFVMSFVRGLK
ncbi:Glycosyl transferase, family 2 [Dissulfuribacter thermophilus]|uniref:Glycosyl transferase, family 2 n=1 Tax=Dissulfuribacter thermophilus TaxID=1156395 RepID=A0A1B9F3Y0_9BACT|nr:glycosyltransferase family 2 protein [Dissulfuribacter thermophilus]OCC14638.1 Glycosyl transferase, family 2 [Dissulfuribacter thermophilus]